MPVISIVQIINKTNIFKYRNKDLAYNEVVNTQNFNISYRRQCEMKISKLITRLLRDLVTN